MMELWPYDLCLQFLIIYRRDNTFMILNCLNQMHACDVVDWNVM